MNTDIIIVGLGPTGATLAGLLGQRGIRVAAFDKLPSLYPLPRAIGLDHEVMRIMQELGVAQQVQEHVAPYRPSEYRGMAGQLIKRLDMAPPPFRLGWAPNYVFNQPEVEHVIRERLSELDTVQVHLQAEVVDHGQDAVGAWIDVRLQGDEQTTRVNAKYLIACDGGSSSIRTRLGLALEDLDFHEHWLVVDMVVHDDKLPALPQTQVQYCEASRPATFVVLPGNHRRWEIMLLPGDSLSPDFPEEELWPLLKRWITPAEGKLWRAAAYRFHGLVAHKWRQGRIFLAGDAAHMTPPFMAQGMVQGLRDALNIAWKLERVLTGRSPDALLETYCKERRPHVVETTRSAIALGRVICERDPERARQRDTRLIAEQGGEVRTLVRQNMIPDLQHGLIAANTPGAGSLFPQPRVRSAGFEGLLDDLAGRGIRVVLSKDVDDHLCEQWLRYLEPLDGTLLRLSAPAASPSVGSAPVAPVRTIDIDEVEPVLAPWLDSIGQTVAIARPDNYVYGTARTQEEGLALLQRLACELGTEPSANTGEMRGAS